MFEENLKEVWFHKYCPKCKHFSLEDIESPCNECLEEPANVTNRPVRFEEKKKFLSRTNRKGRKNK